MYILYILGATRTEMIIAHWLIQSIFLLVQVSLGFLLVILVYGVYCKGSLILAIFITLLEGISGLSYGKERVQYFHLL